MQEQNNLISQGWEIAQKGVGVVAGAMQAAAGVGICYGSLGALCVMFGIPLMAHGANNMYENGRNLWEGRSDTEGPMRKGYQQAAKMVGGDKRAGNIAYGSVDLGMSGYGIFRNVLKPDAWRLFRYVHTDYVKGINTMSKASLNVEAFSNGMTLKGMFPPEEEK